MWVFKGIDDNGNAILSEGRWETPWTRRGIGKRISELEEEVRLPFISDYLKQELRANLAEFRKAEEAFKALDSAPQVSAEPKEVRRDAPSSPATAAPAFAQTAAPSDGQKTTYQFAGIGNGSMETYLYKGDVCIRSGDPSVFEALLSECPPDPDKIGAVRAAARAARMVQELVGQGKNPLGSGKFKKLLVFQGVDNEGRKPKAVFAVYNGRTGESGQPFRKTLPELNRLTADVADYGEHEAAIKALEEALGNGNALSAPAVPEREAQPSAGLLTGGRRFMFHGLNDALTAVLLSESRDVTETLMFRRDPNTFAALLPECHPDSIGPVRAAMATAMLISCARETGENPRDVFPREVRVFAGVGKDDSGRDCARFHVYNVYSGGESVGERYSRSLERLRHVKMQGAFDSPLEEKEIQAAIEALEALGNENAPSSRVAATKPEARRSFSQGAGAAAAPEVSKASVQFVRVTTEARKGVPHAEGVFCPAGVRQSMAEKTYLTAEQIEEKIAPLAEGNPDRALYEAVLEQVKQKNEELGAVPVRVMDEFRPR